MIVALVLLIGGGAGLFLWLRRGKSPHASPPPSASTRGIPQEPDKIVYGRYAGSKSCRNCHAQEYARWEGSHHALAERALDPATDAAAFVPPRQIQIGPQTSAAFETNGHFAIRTLGPADRQATFIPRRVIGVSPLEQFLIPFTNGLIQVTELAYDPLQSNWFDVYGLENRRPGEWGHWTGRGMTWNVMCAECHNTRLRKHYQPATGGYATTMAERGVGCESCHGPMQAHVTWQRQHPNSRSKDPTLRPISPPRMLGTCGACHSRRSDLTGQFEPGERYLDHFAPVIPDRSDIYYADGQVHLEDYEYVSFISSRMYASGVTCWDCHDPHTAKVRLQGNLLCLRCHAGQRPPAPIINPSTHFHHPDGSLGGRCVDCHMPVTVYMQRHARRDHGFTIPDPLLTERFGIPNACNRCHTHHSAAWALAAVKRWYGKRMDRPTRHRAIAIARARAGDQAALPSLLDLARISAIPLWRATATLLLEPWCAQSNVLAAIVARTHDPSPLVRGMAARALEPLAPIPASPAHDAVQGLLSDPVRMVRLAAAWDLHATLKTNSPAAAELERYLNLNSDEPTGLLQLGLYHLDQGNIDEALRNFQRAVRWDGHSAPLRDALATALSLAGRKMAAVSEMKAACRLAPKNAEYELKLGLALNEAGRSEEALQALQRSVRLDPKLDRAWYNLGLAYAARDDYEPALEALLRAETLNPASARIPYARATVLARMARLQQAQNAAERALEIDPNYLPARQLVERLRAGPSR